MACVHGPGAKRRPQLARDVGGVNVGGGKGTFVLTKVYVLHQALHDVCIVVVEYGVLYRFCCAHIHSAHITVESKSATGVVPREKVSPLCAPWGRSRGGGGFLMGRSKNGPTGWPAERAQSAAEESGHRLRIILFQNRLNPLEKTQ